ncbi:MAG: gamma-glutamylcyclotransferase family protein [Pseudomonadota bacterium]
MISDPFFFGYGSLVNTKTHDYARTAPATLKDWTRTWEHTSTRELAFLSAKPAVGTSIEGLIAHVPDDDWTALDVRETGYQRTPLAPDLVQHKTNGDIEIQVYHVVDDVDPTQRCPILMSYLDVVVQGFLTVYGEAGVEKFFATTIGWDTIILDDRKTPKYPRHQILTPIERDLVDAHLKTLPAEIKKL